MSQAPYHLSSIYIIIAHSVDLQTGLLSPTVGVVSDLNRAQKLEIWGSIYTEITESWNVICHRKNSRSQIPKNCADRDPRSQSRIESGIYPEIPHLSGIHIWNLGSGSIKLILRRYNSNFELHALM